MGAAEFAYTVFTTDKGPVTGRSTTVDDLVGDVRRHLDGDVALRPFAVVFTEAVPIEARRRVTDAARSAVACAYDIDDASADWTDDLVTETGWQGVRATIDDALAPCFSGRPEDGDRHHSGVWADERTFLHLELDAVLWTHETPTARAETWVGITHWHPGSMTSGSWMDTLLEVRAPKGSGVLLGVRVTDEDGLYWTLSPRPADPTDAARIVEDFIQGTSLFGAESHLLPLLAHGFPCHGRAAEFTIELLPETVNPGYAISSLSITPPADVVAELAARATLDADGARALRDAILTGATTRWEDSSLEDLADEWRELLARLDQHG